MIFVNRNHILCENPTKNSFKKKVILLYEYQSEFGLRSEVSVLSDRLIYRSTRDSETGAVTGPNLSALWSGARER